MKRSTVCVTLAGFSCLALSPVNHQELAAQVVPLAAEARGLTPERYLEMSREAEVALNKREYERAVVLYDSVTTAYRWNGETWRRLGLALTGARRHREAAAAYVRADSMGILPYPQNNAIAITRAYARAGETDSALVWLRRAVVDYRHEDIPRILADTTLATLRSVPRFNAILGVSATSARSRVDGWRGDVDYLLAEIRRKNAVYHDGPLPLAVTRAAAALKREVPTLSDAQIVVAMQRIVASLGQSHNGVWFPEKGSASRVQMLSVPFTFYPFPDGVFIVDAAPVYEDLIGARVLSFDDTPTEQALNALRVLASADASALSGPAPAWWPGEPTMNSLAMPEVLHALGVIRQPRRIAMTVLDRTGKSRQVIPDTATFRRQRKMRASPLADAGPAPLFLSQPDDYFWFAHLPVDRALYVHVSQVANKSGGETLPAFGLRLRRVVDSTDVRSLILDLRRNNGGNTYLYPELLRTLIHFDAQPGHRLFVIAGRYTYSAAMNLLTDINRLTNAVIVGEPSGGTPIQLGGDAGTTLLPYSGVSAELSTRTWQLTSPGDTRHWIAPDMPVSLTAADYFANRDPVLEAVLRVLRRPVLP
jgi:tetratricopeptide (TPR) repeat protein